MTPTLTPSALYCLAMQCDLAGDLMHELCKALGTPYPPKPNDFTVLTGKTSLQNIIEDFEEFSNGKPAPSTLAN